MDMRPVIDVHPPEEVLEHYALGRLDEAQIPPLEEHLLICRSCQQNLEELDQYISTMRQVTRELAGTRAVARGGLFAGLSKPIWAASCALVFVVAVAAWQNWAPTGEVAVQLKAHRGAELPVSRALAGRPLLLDPDLAELPPSASYRLELVNAGGRRVWEGLAWPAGESLSVRVAKRLKPGVYWVRLYSPSSELLREYGLRLD